MCYSHEKDDHRKTRVKKDSLPNQSNITLINVAKPPNNENDIKQKFENYKTKLVEGQQNRL